MKVSFVSSNNISQTIRNQLARMQSDLLKSEAEMSSNRIYDRGLTLGSRTGQTISFARDIARLEGITDSNALVKGRLTATQNSLGQLHDAAKEFLSTLSTAFSDASVSGTAKTQATATLNSLNSIINGSFNGEYLFAGINTDMKPLADFSDPASPNRIAFDNAFAGYFGFPQSDPAAAGISAADMQNFLATAVEPEVLGAGWDANWSTATDQVIVSRIALNETANTSVSANDEAIRKLAMAAASVSSLLDAPLTDGARTALLDRAIALVSEAMAGIANVQADTGILENRVTGASERIATQVKVLQTNVQDLEGIDPYEVSTRISQLLSQIEVSYTLTARIQQLSLTRFLS
jgi:flagellar hook-associated protein 3 FlgL